MTNEEAIDIIRQYEYCEEHKEACEMAIEALNRLADTVKVVRCKDCFMQNVCKAKEFYGDNGYCSIGERSEESENK